MRTGGRGKHNFVFGGAFLKAKYEIRRRRKKLESESEGGQKFLPPNPLPFCPPAWASPPKLFGGRAAGHRIERNEKTFLNTLIF